MVMGALVSLGGAENNRTKICHRSQHGLQTLLGNNGHFSDALRVHIHKGNCWNRLEFSIQLIKSRYLGSRCCCMQRTVAVTKSSRSSNGYGFITGKPASCSLFTVFFLLHAA